MLQLFVTSDTAQIVSFVAKIVVGLTIPQIASLISFMSTPKALIFFFFGDFGNLFALANDIRWYPSVRKHRQRKHEVRFISVATVLLAIVFCSAVLVTDLLLFQLSARKDGYQLKKTQTNLTFTDSYYPIGNSTFIYPSVMESNQTAQKVFGNNRYASNDGGVYKNYTTLQDYYYTIDGPQGDVPVSGNYTGDPRCTVAHGVIPSNIANRVSPVRIRCYFDNVVHNSSNIHEETVNTLGFKGQKVASFYQTNEGANYLFVQLVQRVHDHLETYNGSNGVYLLETKVKGIEDAGYKLENAILNIVPVNMTNNTMNLKELIESSVSEALNNDYLMAYGNFLFSKTELTFKYGTIPMYTKKFILWDTYFSPTLLSGEGKGNIFSYSYDTRQYLVKGGKLRETLYGLHSALMTRAPLSVQISTDLSDDEIVLASLQNPNYPLRVVETEMVNILPGVIVIAICGLFLVIAITINQFGRHNSNTHLPFDINLEIFHKSLDNLNGPNAWYLPAKLEGSKNIVMTKGVSLMSNKYAVGLVSKGGATGDSSGLQLHSLNQEHKTHLSFQDA